MAIKGKEELKKLNTLQVKLQSEIEAIKIEREILNNKLQSAERNLGKIREEIKKYYFILITRGFLPLVR